MHYIVHVCSTWRSTSSDQSSSGHSQSPSDGLSLNLDTHSITSDSRSVLSSGWVGFGWRALDESFEGHLSVRGSQWEALSEKPWAEKEGPFGFIKSFKALSRVRIEFLMELLMKVFLPKLSKAPHVPEALSILNEDSYFIPLHLLVIRTNFWNILNIQFRVACLLDFQIDFSSGRFILRWGFYNEPRFVRCLNQKHHSLAPLTHISFYRFYPPNWPTYGRLDCEGLEAAEWRLPVGQHEDRR